MYAELPWTGAKIIKSATMAYNRRKHLLKVLRVQEIYSEYSRKGCTNEFIFANLIEPHFYISRTTFYEYLRTPASRDLRSLDPVNKAVQAGQMSIF